MKDELPTDFNAEDLKRKYAEEREKRLRQDGTAQYRELSGALAHMDEDPFVDTGLARDPVSDDVDVVIIGGGFSGLLTAGKLRKAGVKSIRIIDKAGDFGGTWYWNRYPGCACDIESYIYLPLLEETGYIPVEKYSKAPEIYAYCRKLGETFDLYDKALFQTAVTELRWDDTRLSWIVGTDRGDSFAARFAVVAGGFLSKPKVPAIPGIDGFSGHSFHTARWDYGYTGGDASGGLTGLADKRVGIIGTGATALQCIPFLARHAGHLYVFQRTPSSCDARNNRPTDYDWANTLEPGWQRRRMENFNNIISGVPEPEDLVQDGWTEILANVGFLDSSGKAPDPEELQLAELAKMEKSRRRIDTIVKDPATAAALKPYYNYLCKRPGFNDEYLQTFNRDNVTLVDTQGKGVERVTPAGPVVAGQEYPVDCLIYATGFEFLTEYTSQIGYEIYGRGGVALTDRWSEGTRTFQGIMTCEFPNLFILGFAQNGISANFTHLAGERAEHLAYIVGRCVEEEIATIEPTAEAEEAWVQEIIDGRGPRRAFLNACTPSYYNLEGKETPATALNDIYAAGAQAFFDVLRNWREEDALSGLQLMRAG